jgi:ABC-type transporter Mla subunit MlaD
MANRILGYVIIALILTVLSIPIVVFIRQELVPSSNATIRFNDVRTVGFLNKDDPVRVKGAIVGTVTKIDRDRTTAIVTIKITKSVQLYDDYSITAFLKGLMGERFVSINPGTSTNTPVMLDKELTGTFLAGPSEVIAYVTMLMKVLKDLNALVVRLRDGDNVNQSFVKQFHDISAKADTLSLAINKTALSLDNLLDKNRDTIRLFIGNTMKITDTISSELPLLIEKINKTITVTNDFFVKLDSFVYKTDTVVASLNTADNILWKDDLKKLQTDLIEVQRVIKDIQTDGLKLPLRIRLGRK